MMVGIRAAYYHRQLTQGGQIQAMFFKEGSKLHDSP